MQVGLSIALMDELCVRERRGDGEAAAVSTSSVMSHVIKYETTTINACVHVCSVSLFTDAASPADNLEHTHTHTLSTLLHSSTNRHTVMTYCILEL